MSAIRVLDQELVNQIAAGEVIERPASVVKELLENAIDAGATNIDVEVGGSGLDLIRMADNGSGMTEVELELAILRHATSKIGRPEDLFSIRTLGFRGEALPSIMSVSRSTIASRKHGSSTGWSLTLEAGEVRGKSMKGMTQGTMVEIRDLFFNTPARRKFLKSAATEQRHIIDIISRYALAYPLKRFSLSINGRTVLNLREGSTLEERVEAIWGKEAGKRLYPVSEERPELSIHGILASPEMSRPGRSGIYTYVNKRSVMDHTLRAAVLDGYRGMLMKQRF
ncbi:MAG TPA: DNA mismatch repair endonuclease MutL, partial [Deltaproteobacteria bacterium]|nr:DNA mismatch repair endonuclease MutL [Deltaproteobacteria bacterium]